MEAVKILFILFVGLAMVACSSVLVTGLPVLAKDSDNGDSGDGDSNSDSGGSSNSNTDTSHQNQQDQQSDSGPPITPDEIKHPKTIHIKGQNKCQTLDGFSPDEPCPTGSHHNNKHKHISVPCNAATTPGTPCQVVPLSKTPGQEPTK